MADTDNKGGCVMQTAIRKAHKNTSNSTNNCVQWTKKQIKMGHYSEKAKAIIFKWFFLFVFFYICKASLLQRFNLKLCDKVVSVCWLTQKCYFIFL